MLDESDQLAVIRGLRDGHQDAWTALYDGYSTDVWRYVARLVGSTTVEVADVVQDTFLAAAKSARQFDPNRGTLWSWLTGIAHHQVSNYWRQVKRKHRLQELAQSEGTQLRRWLDESESGADIWERREMTDVIRATLASLTADYAAMLTAKYLDDRSLQEMTIEFGGTVEGNKSKLARARREFRAKFERLTRDVGGTIDLFELNVANSDVP